jgi:hypothetical protein
VNHDADVCSQSTSTCKQRCSAQAQEDRDGFPSEDIKASCSASGIHLWVSRFGGLDVTEVLSHATYRKNADNMGWLPARTGKMLALFVTHYTIVNMIRNCCSAGVVFSTCAFRSGLITE